MLLDDQLYLEAACQKMQKLPNWRGSIGLQKWNTVEIMTSNTEHSRSKTGNFLKFIESAQQSIEYLQFFFYQGGFLVLYAI